MDQELEPKIQSNKVLLDNLFRFQVLGLYKLVTRFGGAKLGQNLDRQVIDSALEQNWAITIDSGKIIQMRTDLPWSIYADVMQSTVDFTVSIMGHQLVGARINAITEALERRTQKSYFEVAYRIGLLRPSSPT